MVRIVFSGLDEKSITANCCDFLCSYVQFANVKVIGYSNKWVCRVSVITPRSSHNVEV